MRSEFLPVRDPKHNSNVKNPSEMDLDPYSMMEIAQRNLECSSKQAAQNEQFQQQGLQMQPLIGQAAEMHQKMTELEQTKVQLNVEREEMLKQQASVTAQPTQMNLRK